MEWNEYEDMDTCEDVSELTDIYTEKGIKAVAQRLQEKLKDYGGVSVIIGVTGECGAGKSSFINTMRGLNADHNGAAAVGVKETTQIPTNYPHPQKPNVVFRDLPGVGATELTPEKYAAKMEFNTLDFFIIVSSERFSNSDMLLAMEIKKCGRKFYFLRSKIDVDIINAKQSHPISFNVETTIQTIREDIRENLASRDLQDMRIFLVNNYAAGSYDFLDLKDSLLENLTAIKDETYVSNMHAYSSCLLDEAEDKMRSRMVRLAMLAAITGFTNDQHLDLVSILVSELFNYKNQLCLDDESLESLALSTKTNASDLKGEIKSRIAQDLTRKTVLELVAKSTTDGVKFSDRFHKLIPCVRKIMEGNIEIYETSYVILSYSLTEMKADADRVRQKAFDNCRPI